MKTKNKKYNDLKSMKRKEMNALEKDANSSKIMLKQMISEKRGILEGIKQEIDGKANDISNLSKEIIFSDKLLKSKKEMLASVKKEYKELFTLCTKK